MRAAVGEANLDVLEHDGILQQNPIARSLKILVLLCGSERITDGVDADAGELAGTFDGVCRVVEFARRRVGP